jgi:hypothetical protein
MVHGTRRTRIRSPSAHLQVMMSVMLDLIIVTYLGEPRPISANVRLVCRRNLAEPTRILESSTRNPKDLMLLSFIETWVIIVGL